MLKDKNDRQNNVIATSYNLFVEGLDEGISINGYIF